MGSIFLEENTTFGKRNLFLTRMFVTKINQSNINKPHFLVVK